MRISRGSVFLLTSALLLAACSDERAPTSDAASGDTTGDSTTAPDAASCDEKAKPCASEFGSLFTKTNGRADGTLVAIVRPADTQCALPNSTHVVLQLSILGQVQRLVVSVNGVAVKELQAPLYGPAFSEGWHPDLQLDYPGDLGVHSGELTSVTMDAAVDFICARLELGAPVSVYAYSNGSKPSSAHQIHRNDNYPDGAVVADPKSASPTYLLFRYENQVF